MTLPGEILQYLSPEIIEKMKAGERAAIEAEEINRRIATEILGLPAVEFGPDMKCPECNGEVDFRIRAWCFNCHEWFYSAYRDYCGSREAAFDLLNRWPGDWKLRKQNDILKCELFRPSDQWDAWDNTVELAICKAILTAQVAFDVR